MFNKEYLLSITVFSMSCLFLVGCKRANNYPTDAADTVINGAIVIDSSSIWVLDAAMFYSKDEFANALTSYKKLVAIDSANGEYYYRIGYCLAQLNKHAEAVGNYEKAASFGYKKFEAYRSIGIIYNFVLKDESKAIKYFNKCLEIDGNSLEIKEFIRSIKSGKADL